MSAPPAYATGSEVGRLTRYAVAMVAVAAVYAAVAKFCLTLTSINPSATPIWPPTGFAFAVIMLGGYRMWPAILAGAFVVNMITAGSIATSLAIATGNTLECLVGVYLINRWSQGIATFNSPAGIGRFAALCFFPSTVISATIGVASLAIAGYADVSKLASIWLTWWMGDLAGALLIAPAIVLTAKTPITWSDARALAQSLAVFSAAAIVGLIALSPLSAALPGRGALAFLSIGPLMWAALYQNQRDTALTALILAGFAVWGTLAGSGPFSHSDLNDSFLLLLVFMISTAVPSLALSANVATRDRHERYVESVMLELSHRTKNLLAVVQSVARQTARYSDSFEAFKSAFGDRITALAHVHDLLVARDWQGAEIEDIVRIHLAPFVEKDSRRLTLQGPPLTLKPKAVEQIGLALHELATNASKYGALSASEGAVIIRWSSEAGEDTRPQLRLEWQELGGPQVSAPSRNGFGHLVMTQLVPGTLAGQALLEFKREGLCWTLLVPAPQVVVTSK